MNWTKKSAGVAAPVIALGFAGAAFGAGLPVSAAPLVVPHTYSGHDNSDETLNCGGPNGQGYVEGVGANRIQPRAVVKETLNVSHLFIARDTESFAFASRIVTSVDLSVTVYFGPVIKDSSWNITLYCTSDPREAWRVLG
jgi:hypothetical protein